MTPTLDPAAHPVLADLAERLRELAGDGPYGAGRDYFGKGLVRQTALAGTTAYATVSGSTDYRVSVAFADEAKVTCTCPAHRRSKFCKHVVAVCTALLERPAEFVPTEPRSEPPEEAAEAPRRREGPARPGNRRAARAAGLETVDRLLAELTDGGLASLGLDKAALLARAGELVRALKLRRLGNRLLALQRSAAPPQTAASRRLSVTTLEPPAFAELLTDAYLTRGATGAHLEGRVALDPRLAEDLLGKTWRHVDLEPVADLDLVEVGFTRADDGEFRIETSYLADLRAGEVYVERSITPLRFSSTPKPRHRLRLQVAEAGLYPGVTPRRIKLRRVRRAPLEADHVDRLLAGAPDSVAELRRRLVERLSLPFGPHEVAVFLRPAALLSSAGRVGAADRDGCFLNLTWPERWTEQLPPLLPPPGRYALFGLLSLADDGLRLRCLSVVGALRWRRGPFYPDAD